MLSAFSVFVLFVVLFALIFVILAVQRVPQGNEWTVERVEIKDITPPQELVAAMARQMKAEREKRANVLEAEGFKQAAVLKAEGEKQAVILAAEARREAAFRDAEARERQAEAEASATTSVSEAIGRGRLQAINYFVPQRYADATGRRAGSQNQKVILMPLESASMIGSLAGIAELARESFSTARPATSPAVGPPTGR